jgi:hypothetical protein
MDYAIAIDRLRPGAKWRRSDDYAALVATWEDDTDIPTDQELIDAYDEWSATESATAASAAAFRAVIDAGYAVTPEGFTLGMDEQDRKNFAELAVMLREAEALGAITGESSVTIHDVDGVARTVTLTRYRQIIVGLGSAYKAAFDARNAA